MATFHGVVWENDGMYVRISLEDVPLKRWDGLIVLPVNFFPENLQPVKKGDEMILEISVDEKTTRNLRLLQERLKKAEGNNSKYSLEL